ncbi:MAG TPA: hypothetical protein VHL52_14695 [Acidimicrobiia bacterium]|nr:hypothetical protein [Acidimicrobiia bacterium]
MLVLLAVAAPAALAAGGGKPLVRERFNERFVEEPEQFVLDVCGVEVRTEFHFRGHFTLYPDMTARVHFNDHIVSTDPDTGKVLLVERNSANVFSQPVVEVIDEEAGTLTVMFEDTVRGVPLKWRIPGEGVILLDAGTVTITGTVVFDLATDEVISFEETFSDLHGPHPSLTEPESEIGALFCGAMEG